VLKLVFVDWQLVISDIYSSKNDFVLQIKENEMDGACSLNETRNANTILVRKLEGKRPLGRLIWTLVGCDIKIYHKNKI
jgi:hypothetical protein